MLLAALQKIAHGQSDFTPKERILAAPYLPEMARRNHHMLSGDAIDFLDTLHVSLRRDAIFALMEDSTTGRNTLHYDTLKKHALTFIKRQTVAEFEAEITNNYASPTAQNPLTTNSTHNTLEDIIAFSLSCEGNSVEQSAIYAKKYASALLQVFDRNTEQIDSYLTAHCLQNRQHYPSQTSSRFASILSTIHTLGSEPLDSRWQDFLIADPEFVHPLLSYRLQYCQNLLNTGLPDDLAALKIRVFDDTLQQANCSIPESLQHDVHNIFRHGIPQHIEKPLSLKPPLTLGMEGEYSFLAIARSSALRQIKQVALPGWHFDEDDSIHEAGVPVRGRNELVSEVFDSNTIDRLPTLLQLVEAVGVNRVNSSTATHIHIGGMTLDQKKQFAVFYHSMEDELSFLQRRLTHQFSDICQKAEVAPDNALQAVLNADNVEAVQLALRPDVNDKNTPGYAKLMRNSVQINILNANQAHETMEIRQLSGTCNVQERTAFIRLLLNIANMTTEVEQSQTGIRMPTAADKAQLSGYIEEFIQERGGTHTLDGYNLSPAYRATAPEDGVFHTNVADPNTSHHDWPGIRVEGHSSSSYIGMHTARSVST